MNHASRLALFSALALAAAAQDKTVQDVISADRAWAAAITKMDYAALEKLLSDELVYTHSTGLIDTKKMYLDSLRSGAQKYNSVEHIDPKVQVHGNTAVLTSGLKMDTTTKGTQQVASFRVIHVWVKRGGAWQMVAHQTTRLPQ